MTTNKPLGAEELAHQILDGFEWGRCVPGTEGEVYSAVAGMIESYAQQVKSASNDVSVQDGDLFCRVCGGSLLRPEGADRYCPKPACVAKHAAQVQQAAPNSNDTELAYKLRDTFGPFFKGDRSAQSTMKDAEIILSLWRKEIAQEAAHPQTRRPITQTDIDALDETFGTPADDQPQTREGGDVAQRLYDAVFAMCENTEEGAPGYMNIVPDADYKAVCAALDAYEEAQLSDQTQKSVV